METGIIPCASVGSTWRRYRRATTRVVAAAGVWCVLCTGARADAPPEPDALPVGAAMEDFGLRELDMASGKLRGMFWLSDYVGAPNRKHPSTQVVLLNFFASWCKPCQSELATLTRLQTQYAAQGLRVLSIYVRRANETFESASNATRQLLSSSQLGFPMLFDRYTERTQQLYMGRKAVLPCNVLINAAGRVTGRYQGSARDQLTKLEAQLRDELGLRTLAAP